MNKVMPISAPPEVRLARQQLRAAGRRHAGRRAAAALLPALAACGLLATLGHRWPAAQPVLVVAGVLGLMVLWLLLGLLRETNPTIIAPRLDRHFAELEDSTGLLLHDAAELNLLEGLQQQRVARQLSELHAARALTLPVDFRRPAGLTVLLLLTSAALWWWPTSQKVATSASVPVHFSTTGPPARADQKPTRIEETRVLATPPAYTRLAAFAPAQASFACPQGSRVRWRVRVSGTGQSAPELELGRQRLRLQPVPGQPGIFSTEQVLTASTLYRLRYAGTVSDDYAIDVRADQAPVLRIQTPKPYTLVPTFGRRPEVPIRATVRDDYGLTRAELVVTVAQGQGEAVKFREVRRDLSAALANGAAQAILTSTLNLTQLGLTYGDELYFYLIARDNAGHSTRTDSYLVQWQDTAVADSPADVGMGVKVAPAYFRSQRQIIIDTEKLIAEKPKLDAATVANRANALGFDQQTLRLRYGKFMGEEAEQAMGAAPHSPIAEDEDAPAANPTAAADEHHDHAPAPTSPAKASPTAETDELMEPYMHRHDDAETADFLEPAVKAKLRAVLDQMWAAELRLRTGQLAAARPYEYRALRLLKQVQQQTRAFVKKAGFVPPPMPEATLRLTGDLAGAGVPHRLEQRPAPAAQPVIRAALRVLAAPSGRPVSAAEARVLERAGSELAGAALQRPGAYLPALRALRQLVADARNGRPTCADCRPPVERALTDLLAAPAAAPTPPPGPDRLARRYFQELTR